MSRNEQKEKQTKNVKADSSEGSSRRRLRPVEDELPPQLKSIEAELASLAPRTDRLDRERLIFLAGQASVLGVAHRRASTSSGWGWPAATAVMTTVAAALMVTLLVRPGPQVDRRFAEIPDTVADGEVATEDRQPEALPVDEERVEPVPSTDEPIAEPVRRPNLLALIGLGWMQNDDLPPAMPEPPHRRYLNQMLARGLDFPARPVAVRKRNTKGAAVDASYRQLLNRLRDESLPDERSLDWPPAGGLL